ncbi:hypothetical protein [Gracilimonas sp.]|uniref:hypothetical protein n=1 Tax=Gracilimonas sp. TaxID=1974203 RepID=UPI003BADA549
MKSYKLTLLTILLSSFLLTGCTIRLVDYTVISTKNAEIGVDRSLGVPTEGKATYFLGIGLNLEDALDTALEKAGTKYDLLIDGVVSYQNLPFVTIVKVDGLAISSQELKASLGAETYQELLTDKNVYQK